MPVTYDLQKEGFEYETIRTYDSSAVDDVCGSTAGAIRHGDQEGIKRLARPASRLRITRSV